MSLVQDRARAYKSYQSINKLCLPTIHHSRARSLSKRFILSHVTMASESFQFSRRAYNGSCHCGATKYILYLTLPTASSPKPPIQTVAKESGLRIYKCNCTVCQKMSIFHIRLPNAPTDFLLLSPLNPPSPNSGLTSYKVNAGLHNWYFCSTCGVRCFVHRGKGENAEVEIDGENVNVWRPAAQGWNETTAPEPRPSYLSVNAVTLEVGPGETDLRKWHEDGWIQYVENLDGEAGGPFKKPE
jgi:hypothetical protein